MKNEEETLREPGGVASNTVQGLMEHSALPTQITPRSFWLVIYEHRPAVITIAPTGTHFFACGQEEAWPLSQVTGWLHQIHIVSDLDKKRLDWLDDQRAPVTIDGETLLAYRWELEGQRHGLREAIDAARGELP